MMQAKDYDSMFSEVEDWLMDFIQSTAGEGDKSARKMRRKVSAVRKELELMHACAAYECCCIQNADCDCFTKRDAAWRTIPGNYVCPKCCNEDCAGKGACDPTECTCDDESCAAFKAGQAREMEVSNV